MVTVRCSDEMERYEADMRTSCFQNMRAEAASLDANSVVEASSLALAAILQPISIAGGQATDGSGGKMQEMWRPWPPHLLHCFTWLTFRRWGNGVTVRSKYML